VTMQGRRVPDDTDWRETVAGDYGKQTWRGFDEWWIRDPNGTPGRLGSHSVTEHEDGTITVSPSIAGAGWHGWLKRGVWSAA
jgi:hypothetical protein